MALLASMCYAQRQIRGTPMSVQVVSAPFSEHMPENQISGDNGDVFIVTHTGALSLMNNTGSLTFIHTQPTPYESLELFPNDVGETIVDLNRIAAMSTAPAEIVVQFGLSGLSYIYGFAKDPNASLLFVKGDPAVNGVSGTVAASSDGHGGTLVSLATTTTSTGAVSYGAIDIVGDSHFGISGSASGSQVLLRNI